MNKNDIARHCALRLFQNSIGEAAVRLVLVDKNERNLGGWCMTAFMDVIAEEVEAARKRDNKALRKRTKKA